MKTNQLFLRLASGGRQPADISAKATIPGYQRADARRSPRSGFTLMELLIVVVITLALTAIAIPVLVPSQAERRMLETGRLVTTMLATAKNRAIETGRPVGVTLERMPGLPEAAISLRFAEVQAPYSGSQIDSQIHLASGDEFTAADDTNSDGHWQVGESLTNDWNGDGVYTGPGVSGITFAPTMAVLDGVDDSSWMGLIRIGDLIKLNYQGHSFRIIGAGSVDANGYIDAPPTAVNPWTLDNSMFSVRSTPFTDAGTPNNRHDPGEYRTGVPFQIIRLPVNSAAEPLQLPETMAIDLTESVAGDSILNGLPGDITIIFNPGGSIESVRWSGNPLAMPSVPGGSIRPLTPIFLLLGKREFIPSNLAPEAGEPTYNWQDLTARWVGVNHATGLVASSPNTASLAAKKARASAADAQNATRD